MNSFLLNPLLLNNNVSIEKFEDSYTTTWITMNPPAPTPTPTPAPTPAPTSNNENIIIGLYCSSSVSRLSKNYIIGDSPIIKNNFDNLTKIQNETIRNFFGNNYVIQIGSSTNIYAYKNIYQGLIKFDKDGNYRFKITFNFLNELRIIVDNIIIFDTLDSKYIDKHNIANPVFYCYVSNKKANIYYPIMFVTKYNVPYNIDMANPYVSLDVSNTDNIYKYYDLKTLLFIPKDINNYNETFINNLNKSPTIVNTPISELGPIYQYHFVFNENKKNISVILLNDTDKDNFLISYSKGTNAIVEDPKKQKEVIGYYKLDSIPTYFNNNYYLQFKLDEYDNSLYYFKYHYLNLKKDICRDTDNTDCYSQYNSNYNNPKYIITYIGYGIKYGLINYDPPVTGIYVLSNLTQISDFIFSFTNEYQDYKDIAYSGTFKIPYRSRLLSVVVTAGCESIRTLKITMTGYSYFLKDTYYQISGYTLDSDLSDTKPIEANTNFEIKYTTLEYFWGKTYGIPSNKNDNNLGIIMYFEILPPAVSIST